MKRVLIALLMVAALLAGWVWLLNFHEERIEDGPVGPPSAEQVSRGAYLARAGNCMGCHTERGGEAFAGGRTLATPFGALYASNLTPDLETGLGRWTPGQFWRALHHGRSADGRLLYPAFPYPYYTQVTRADADALFAYLRSVPPVRKRNRIHALRWPYNTQTALAVWRALYFRPADQETVANVAADRGAYLVRGLGHCGACHSPRNALGGTHDLMDLSGGVIPMQNWYAPSLSARSEAGVADWPTAQVVQLLQTGAAPRGTVLGPMAEVVLNSTQHLSAADLQAMAGYLKSLPSAPAQAESDPYVVPAASAAVRERGGKLYGEHCAQCHGDSGQGVPKAYPPLAGNRAVTLPVTVNLVQVLLHGGFAPATEGNPRPFGMPPYALVLNDADIAAVLSYIRGAWGNRGAPVGEFEVSQQRGSAQ
ncbi:MAG: cytochrome c [Pseudomonadota bacterium]